MIEKILYKKIIVSFLVFFLSLNCVEAQKKRLSKSTYRALNNYIVYSNEAVHALNLMYFDFIYLNDQFFRYVEDSLPKVAYTKENILTNSEYFPIYPRELYPNILNDNIYIPYDKRGAPLQLIGKVVNVLTEIEKTRSLLDQYVNTGDYLQDTNLVQGFQWLRRMEVLYYDMFTLQEKLHWSLSAILQMYQIPLTDTNAVVIVNELQPLLKQSKLVIKSIRAKDNSSSLSYNALKLAEFIRQLEARRNKILGSIKRIPNSLRSPEKRFDLMISRAKSILKTGREYKSNALYQNLNFKPSYYYYNINLLDKYNRTDNGIATLFNKFVEDQGVYWLFEYEMPHMFEVLYPDIPVFEQFKDPELDIEKLIEEALLARAKQDSLNKIKTDSLVQVRQDSVDYAQHLIDSINYRNDNPEIGDMNLNGFASNNLVFLLDISSSMRDTNKLPLLREALVQLLDLMREEDNITFITFSAKAEIVLKTTSATNKEQILAAISNLASSGSSDANKGLRLAYKTIDESMIKEGNNRIIMATDGAIKVSKRVKRLIKRKSKEKDKIRLSVFYFSQKEFTHHKELLNELAEEGDGKYSYIKKENAKKILVTEAQAVRKKEGGTAGNKKDVQ